MTPFRASARVKWERKDSHKREIISSNPGNGYLKWIFRIYLQQKLSRWLHRLKISEKGDREHCDQIEPLLKNLVDIFSYKISPSIGQH